MSNQRLAQGLGDPVLLDKLDQLLACGLGQYIDLPQLIVVGDQSSGKSSVLEGLTKLPFPRDKGLCTRFATHIILRRTSATSTRKITASIIPDKDSDPVRAARLAGWKTTSIDSLETGTFVQTMWEVHKIMGLTYPGVTNGTVKATFARDVFQLEICGPGEDHLSVIDIPGIFKNVQRGRTTDQDVELVKDMVFGYMRNPRSIMLAVIPACVDIATQEILPMARKCDPEGIRTLGILTKPDMVSKGDEEEIIDLIEGKTGDLMLGWSVVRNPSNHQLREQNFNRNMAEDDFFRTSPWNRLRPDKVGVGALMARLQEVQTAHTRREFPKVRAEARKLLNAARASEHPLGPERNTLNDQRIFLIDIIERFRDMASDAISPSYGANAPCENDTEAPLGTIVRNRMDVFKHDMALYGMEYKFFKASDSSALIPTPNIPNIYVRKVTDTLEDSGALDGVLHEQESIGGPAQRGILQWIEKRDRISRRFETGTIHPSMLSEIFTKQSRKWAALALGYVSDVIAAVHTFIIRSLRVVCPDEQVRTRLVSVLAGDLSQRYKESIEQAQLLLNVERNAMLTLDDQFEKNLAKRRKLNPFPDTPRTLQSNLEEPNMMDPKHRGQYIHDVLESYYDVAFTHFVDSICKQVTFYCLLTGPRRPLQLFSARFVMKLTEEQLREIVEEEPALKRRREQLKREIEGLEKAQKILM